MVLFDLLRNVVWFGYLLLRFGVVCYCFGGILLIRMVWVLLIVLDIDAITFIVCSLILLFFCVLFAVLMFTVWLVFYFVFYLLRWLVGNLVCCRLRFCCWWFDLMFVCLFTWVWLWLGMAGALGLVFWI